MQYDVKLNERELSLIIELLNHELSEIVGDLGYQELSRLLYRLDGLREPAHLANSPDSETEDVLPKNKSHLCIDDYRNRNRKARKEIIGYIVRNGIIGCEIKQEIERYCTEHSINDKNQFLALTVHELSKLHTGALWEICVTEEMFREWEEANNQNNKDE